MKRLADSIAITAIERYALFIKRLVMIWKDGGLQHMETEPSNGLRQLIVQLILEG